MKLLIVLIILVCAGIALWYFRDEITGMALRFEEREEAGARFEAPNWPESMHEANPADGWLILKHKKHENRIFYVAWQYGEGPSTSENRLAAAKEFAHVLGRMTQSSVSVKPEALSVEVGAQKAHVFPLVFEKIGVGPATFYVWHSPLSRQRWFFAIVDDDPTERKRIAQRMLDSFQAGRGPIDYASAAKGKLVFDIPPGWRVLSESPLEASYALPGQGLLLQLSHGTRTRQPNMTKEYAEERADRMIEAAGATWRSREVQLEEDWALGHVVAHVRGDAVIEGSEHFFELRLWISPRTNLLYVAALSAPDEQTLEKHLAVFNRLVCQE